MRWPQYLRVLSITGCLLMTLAASRSEAIVNLPLACPVTVVNGTCSSATYTLQLGADGMYVATPSAGWKKWEDLLASDLIRVCPTDQEPGSSCPGNRISVPKSQGASTSIVPPTGDSFTIKVSWVHPSKNVDSTPLVETDIVGYGIEWKTDEETEYHVVTTGRVMDHTLVVPKTNVCLRMYTIAKSGNSARTTITCLAPKTALPGVPAEVKVTFGEP